MARFIVPLAWNSVFLFTSPLTPLASAEVCHKVQCVKLDTEYSDQSVSTKAIKTHWKVCPEVSQATNLKTGRTFKVELRDGTIFFLEPIHTQAHSTLRPVTHLFFDCKPL